MAMNTPTPDDRSHRPLWFNFVFYLIGRPPALTRHQWRVLGLVSIVSLFEQYDVYLFSLNLKQIQAELGIAEASLGWIASAVRAGAFFALPLTLAADRLGRRRVLLYTILGYTLCTGATAFAPDAATFVGLQFLARMFAAAEAVIAVVVIAEEFDAAHRGWGIGALGAIHAVGAGMAGGFFALVDVLPYGWRALYLVGLVPLLLTAHLRRTLPETARFDALRRDAEELQRSSSLAPALELLRRHPGRLAMLAVAVFAIEVVAGPATFFAPKFLQESHGWSPESVSMLVSMGGALGTLGNPVAGRLSDRRGRKPVTLLFTLFVTLAILSFYLLDGR